MGNQIISGNAMRPEPGAAVVRGLQGTSSLTRRTPIHGIYSDFCSTKGKILFKNLQLSTFMNPKKTKKGEIYG